MFLLMSALMVQRQVARPASETSLPSLARLQQKQAEKLGRFSTAQPYQLACPAVRDLPVPINLNLSAAKHSHDRAVAAGTPAHWSMKKRKRHAQFNPRYAGSQYHQDAVLVQIFNAIGHRSRLFVEFGARRPNMLNSAHFRVNCGWCGLLLDGSPGKSSNVAR